jgi:hypothetical protein
MSIQRAVGTDCFGGLRVRINRQIEFATEHLQPANVIAMLVCKQNAIQLFGHHPALFEAQYDLSRAQAPIDQDFAMIGRDQRAIPGTAAPEHPQTEHDRYFSDCVSVFAN